MMRQVNRWRLFINTIRYLSARQMWYRGRRLVRRRWWRLLGKSVPQPKTWQLTDFRPLYEGLETLTEVDEWHDLVANAHQEAHAVAKRHFCFLNQAVTLNEKAGWHDADLSQLWRYHLHYFDYVQPLLVWAATEPENHAFHTFQKLANSWIEHNQQYIGNEPQAADGWHPYTISLRVVNWLHALSGFQDEFDNSSFRNLLLSSLYGQVQMLFSDLELDVRGNHLLENLRTLIWAGIAFRGDEPNRWLQRGLKLLEEETKEQILADGGHFERTPGYHLVVLKDYLEIALWLRRNQGQVPVWLDAAIRRMLDYLVAILPPGNHVALLKDTAWNAAPAPHDLLAAGALYFDEPSYKRDQKFALYPLLLWGAEGWRKFNTWAVNDKVRSSVGFSDSGYYVLRDDHSADYLIFDAGKPCPDYLPAHAHADMLSYELVIEGQRVVVDSGVYEYTAGAWRDYFRSTGAHNTVEVAGQNQSEVWSSFRVARRAKPKLLHWESSASYSIIQAEHDGYQRLSIPVTHRRTLLWQPNQFWLIVDEVTGQGNTAAANHIHFYPDLTLSPVNSSLWQIEGLSAPLWLTSFGEDSATILNGQIEPFRQGWYSEEFGRLRPNTVLTLNQKAAFAADDSLPIRFGYVISKHTPVQIEHHSSNDRCILTISHNGQTHTLTLSHQKTPKYQ